MTPTVFNTITCRAKEKPMETADGCGNVHDTARLIAASPHTHRPGTRPHSLLCCKYSVVAWKGMVRIRPVVWSGDVPGG